MKRIEAIIRPEKLEEVKDALTDAGHPSMSITDIRGRGLQKGVTQHWRGESYNVDLLPKIKIDIVVKDTDVEDTMAVITESAKTGHIGDGKIFVTPVEKALRIRTGDTDTDAI